MLTKRLVNQLATVLIANSLDIVYENHDLLSHVPRTNLLDRP